MEWLGPTDSAVGFTIRSTAYQISSRGLLCLESSTLEGRTVIRAHLRFPPTGRYGDQLAPYANPPFTPPQSRRRMWPPGAHTARNPRLAPPRRQPEIRSSAQLCSLGARRFNRRSQTSGTFPSSSNWLTTPPFNSVTLGSALPTSWFRSGCPKEIVQANGTVTYP